MIWRQKDTYTYQGRFRDRVATLQVRDSGPSYFSLYGNFTSYELHGTSLEELKEQCQKILLSLYQERIYSMVELYHNVNSFPTSWLRGSLEGDISIACNYAMYLSFWDRYQYVDCDEYVFRLKIYREDGSIDYRSLFSVKVPPEKQLSKKILIKALRPHIKDGLLKSIQSRRMARDPKVRRLATEFACQWLQIYEFDALDEKSERHFPTFNALRGEMYEESILFFEDLFRSDATVLSIFNADHSYLNENLARHYGIPNVTGPEMRRVEGLKQYGRGGILTHSTALAKQSGASRTSPILRGIWISEVLLGEKLPKPPKDVPQLPEDEADTELSVRQLVEKHTSDPRCATCHQRIDPFGFSLEGYDAIGRKRDKDLGDRPLDVRAEFRDGTTFEGVDGLREHLLSIRREAIVKQFCKKLLGYALAREVLLSDDPLLQEMQKKLEQNDYRISVAIESIVTSRQFREIRGRDAAVAVGE